jgi:hypothetical protein
VTTTRERYDEMIKTTIASELRTSDFRKRRNAFFRKTEHGWTLVDFQASQFGSRDDVSFTINLGVNFAELRPPGEGQPSLGKAHLQQRIGALLDRGKDVWWSLTSNSDFDALAAEINGVLKQTAIPWLQERTVLQDVLAALDDDSEFLASWQRGRLSVLAERRGQEALADRLRRRYPPTER